jgi:DNA-binding NtrC family response regulator
MENQNQDTQGEKVTLDVTTFPTLEVLEREYIGLALSKAGGNKVEAAKILGVSVKTIYNKLATYSAQPKAE